MFGNKPKPGEMKAAFAQLKEEIKHGTPEHDPRTVSGQWALPKPPKRSRLDRLLGRHEQSVTRLTTNIPPKEVRLPQLFPHFLRYQLMLSDLATNHGGTQAAHFHRAQDYKDH